VLKLALAAAAVAAALAGFPTWGSAENVTTKATTTNAVPSCSWKDLKFSASMKSRSFEPGQPVVLTSTVTNHSSDRCSVVIGHDHGYDPSQVVVNHTGKFVWDACDLDNKEGACSDLWMLKDLSSGASYTLTSTWDQKWGNGAGEPVQVPAGRYKFGSGYTDLINSVLYNASASVDFVIIRSGSTQEAS
jgi:hypothetical protein